MSLTFLYMFQAFFFTIIFFTLLEIQTLTKKHYDKTERLVDDLIITLKEKNNYWDKPEFLDPPAPEVKNILEKKK